MAASSEKRLRLGTLFAGELSFDKVTHCYGDLIAVRDFSLTIKPGEVLCLLGASGCGKSTVLRIAAGIEHQIKGQVTLDSQVLSSPDHFVPPEQRGIGMVFQDYALFPHMTVLDNVMFGLRKLSKLEARAQAVLALESVGLGDYCGVSPTKLSGGEQQRVALARALVPRPNVLLLDEPFSNLDRATRDVVRDETIRVLRDARATSIVVTHDPEEAMRMGDRIALMDKGQIMQVGKPIDLYRKPETLLAARFFGELNELPGVCDGARVETPLGLVDNVSSVPKGQAVVGVRPEGIIVHEPGVEDVAGRIIRRQFLGSVDQLAIAVNGLDKPLMARTRPDLALAVGDDVSIRLAPLETLVFKPNIS